MRAAAAPKGWRGMSGGGSSAMPCLSSYSASTKAEEAPGECGGLRLAITKQPVQLSFVGRGERLPCRRPRVLPEFGQSLFLRHELPSRYPCRITTCQPRWA